LEQRAQALGVHCEPGAMELLVEKCAGDHRQVLAAFDRLITYRLHDKQIGTADVEEVVSAVSSNLHFRLLDKTAERNITECLRLLEYHTLESAEQFVAALARLFSEALRFYHYERGGLTAEEIGRTIAPRPLAGYALKKAMERWRLLLRRYSMAEICNALDALVRADLLVKEQTELSQQKAILTAFYLKLIDSAELKQY
ncbi:MAG: hypothetical protein N2Z22_01295, partial [Turneriella sp.]|nr:hypothetical protein [Turneriella sp.]